MKKGSKMLPESIRKMSLSHLGKKRSAASIKKGSEKTSGSKHWKWKGGKTYCIDCGQKTTSTNTKRCRNCYRIFIKNPLNHPCWKGGRPKCSECGVLIWRGFNRCNKHGKLKGKEHPNWKGGITPLKKKIRNSLEYKKWRESVFKRDNWTCLFCKKIGGDIEADHIKPFAYFPDLRFELSNGRTLCKNCHRKTDTWGVKK